MGISTSTGTLIAGQSRTFNLSPASAVTLTLSPNVRVTITETPATVAATGLGGNASRVHEPRLPGSFTYGPYPMGGSVLVENESNSGSSVGWVRSDSIVAESADGEASLVDGGGKVKPLTQLAGVRPRLLVFGNSLAGQSNSSLILATTTLSAAALAGASSVTVASIAGLSSADKIAIGLYDGTVFYTTISGAPSGLTVVLATPLPKMARSAASLTKYTTGAVSGIRRTGGAMYQALASMGMPVDLIQGYGYGGGTLPEIMLDLPRVLQATRPQFVHFIDVENSIGTLTAAQLIAWSRYKVETCLSFGAIPLVNTAYPSAYYGAGAPVVAFDTYNLWVTQSMAAEFPGAVALDVGKQWIDPATPTLRAPLAGWTDGIHPNALKFATIGALYATALASVLPQGRSLADYALTSNSTMQGSGGTNSGMQGGSVVPASWTYTADAGVTSTSSVGGSAGSRVVMAVPGASNVSSTTLRVWQRFTFPAGIGSAEQSMMGFIKVKFTKLTGLTLAFPYLQFSGGEQYSAGQDSDLVADPALLGNTYQLETPVVKIPLGATYVDIIFWVRPTSSLSNGVDVDFEILEMGVAPAAFVTH